MELTNPTLDNCDAYLDGLLDKLGSDYFPLPIKLERFIGTAYSLIHSNLVYFETNQMINDDIKPLIVQGDNYPIIKNGDKWHVPEPSDYYRLIDISPLSKKMRISREVSILRNGQEVLELNPFREPTPEYPVVYRISDFFEIKTGRDQNIYDSAYIKYVKHPTFAKEHELDKRIVNLPLSFIIRILNETANYLRYSISDEFAPNIENYTAKFGKKNRT